MHVRRRETETERPFGVPCAVRSLLLHLQMCNRSLRFDAPLRESQQQMELVGAVLELDAVLGGMAMSSMRSHELEHTAELPKVQEHGCGAHEGTR